MLNLSLPSSQIDLVEHIVTDVADCTHEGESEVLLGEEESTTELGECYCRLIGWEVIYLNITNYSNAGQTTSTPKKQSIILLMNTY